MVAEWGQWTGRLGDVVDQLSEWLSGWTRGRTSRLTRTAESSSGQQAEPVGWLSLTVVNKSSQRTGYFSHISSRAPFPVPHHTRSPSCTMSHSLDYPVLRSTHTFPSHTIPQSTHRPSHTIPRSPEYVHFRPAHVHLSPSENTQAKYL